MKTLVDNISQWVGVVEVYSTETKARLTSVTEDKDGKVKVFPNGKATLDIVLADLPKQAQKVIKPNIDREKPRKFRIRLDKEGESVENVGPVIGQFRLKPISLGPKTKEGVWKMRHKVYNEGQKNETAHDEFFCAYEIQDAPYQGVQAPAYWLHYKFREIPEGFEDEGFTALSTADTPQATQRRKLTDWAEMHGNLLDEPIKWPDDGIILDTLEERLLEAGIEVNGVFENGYIKLIQPIEDYEDGETEAEFDKKFSEKVEVEEVPPSKPAKPVKSKATKGVNKPAKVDDDL